MTLIAYRKPRFHKKSYAIIDMANAIIAENQKEGFIITLRQLYYAFVTRNVFPNSEKSYSNLGYLISEARMAGLVSWDAFEDRTRALQGFRTYDSPISALEETESEYRRDLWEGQTTRVEVWIEKSALIRIIERVCDELCLPFYSSRGYNSLTEQWRAAQRINRYDMRGIDTIILHLADHDPSGLDMTRDLRDRFREFGCDVEIKRVALNYAQVQKFNPPPNPAKVSDSRFVGYQAEYGNDSWELDALQPKTLYSVIRKECKKVINKAVWDAVVARQHKEREIIGKMVGEARKLVARGDGNVPSVS